VSVNFLPGVAGANVVPSGQLEQAAYLEAAGLQPVPIAITRRGSAVHRSIRRSFPHLRNLPEAEFAAAYLAYACAIAPMPRIHIEELRARPEAALGEIIERLGLAPTDRRRLLDRFHEYRNCTGNTTLGEKGRSALAQQVLPPDDDAGSGPVAQAIAEADRLLGYD
jgi:hypothetical protein